MSPVSEPSFLSSLSELALRLQRRELSPVEVVEKQLERIGSLQPSLHAYATLLPDAALQDARRAESEIAGGRYRGPLHGVPVGVKDLCATKGVRTAAGTRVMRERVPDHDATVVERLREAGAVLLGKLELTEGAFGDHHPDIEAPRNPWDPTRWTGVSSSGSGVATAAGLCFGSLGSDTGGSIRFPSACCGVVGVKASYGRVPLYGVFPLAHSLDHVGPMARRTQDCAHLLGALAGFDPRDPTSRREPVPDYAAAIEDGVAAVRIGVDEAYVTDGVSPDVSQAVLSGLRVLEAQGAELVQLRMPAMDELLAAWLPMCAVECALAHEATFPARAHEYGPLRGLLERGASVTGAEYARGNDLRRAFAGELAGLFEDVDLIGLPSFLSPAPSLEVMALATGEVPGALLRFTAPFDFSGSPTISLPCGLSEDGLPLSLQLVGRHLEESLLLRAGHAFERATDFHTLHPVLAG